LLCLQPGDALQWGQTSHGQGANRRGVTREQIAAEPDLLTALEHLMLRRLPSGDGPAPDAQELALRMRLVQDNPELLPRLLAVFEEFDGRVRDLIARRTGRDPADLFCRIAAATAIGAARAVIASWREAPHAAPPPDKDRLQAAFATLRQILSRDSES
jgi:hypothetical protein